MKTVPKLLTNYGNLALVQLEVRPETTFMFKPGEPEIRNGRLIISEAGSVNKLIAENITDSFLLLTDADVLVGAKQNRILNKSILLAPHSKTFLDVSCIERRRWAYTTKNFGSPSVVAAPDLRKSKAQSIAFNLSKPETGNEDTQHKIWSFISEKMEEYRYDSSTESYSDLIRCRLDSQKPNIPACEPQKGCNGLAVLIDRKVINIDIFGREEVYLHYFNRLRDSAFQQATIRKEDKPIDDHEAYYKVLDAIDGYENASKNADIKYSGAGSFFITDNKDHVGFDLEYEKQLIHTVLFLK